MPLKGFKGFNRRKSVGNNLEDQALEPPVVSSFRVLERPHESSKSFDGGHHLARATADARPASEGCSGDIVEGQTPVNRGSSGTQNSVASSGPYYSSSSAHHSSTSTLPSAGSEPAYEDLSATQRGKNPLPHTNTAPPGFFRTAFAGRKSVPQPVPAVGIQLPQQHVNYEDIPDINPQLRQRAMTDTSQTSESTATPSEVLSPGMKHDLNDYSSNMFADGHRAAVNVQSPSSIGASEPQSFGSKFPGPQRPTAVSNVASQPASSSLFSPARKTSRDGLLGTAPKLEVTGLRRKASPQPFSKAEGLRLPGETPSPGSSGAPHSRHASSTRSLIPGGQTPSPPRQSSPIDPLPSFIDEDMQLAMQYINQSDSSPPPSPQLYPTAEQFPSTVQIEPHPQPVPPHSPNAPALLSPDKTETGPIIMTPEHTEDAPASISAPVDDPNDDASMQEIALYADRLEEKEHQPAPPRPKTVNTGKIMTPAQFERYKNEQERRQLIEGSESDSEKEESDKDDEEDEEERNREMARQRRKQEADLAVYRQKMMKITGESVPSQRAASKATGSLTTPIPSISLGEKGSGTTSEEDEDEDVPLGILAAHGFPNKNRPPSHLEGGQASVQYTSETYPLPASTPRAPITASAEIGITGKAVPAFAKNLPKDPFFGASLITPADRQSLAFGSGAASVHGGSQAGSTHGGPTPPGGLVGVIAKEERARAIRRGSPNTGFAESNAAAGLLTPTGGVPGLPPPMSADQQAQLQMTQQMTQMMQLQMQWMQQMMAMQQGMGGQVPQMPPMPQMPGIPDTFPTQGPPYIPYGPRPTPDHPAASSPNLTNRSSTRPNMSTAARSSSALSVTVPSSYGHAAGYAVSLAPSERTTVGQPSRYRPVSTMPNGSNHNHAQAKEGNSDPWTSERSGGPSPAHSPSPGPSGEGHLGLPPALKGTTAPRASRTTVRPTSRTPFRQRASDDEDDDAGWAAMQAVRDKKRGTWKAGSRTASRLGVTGAEDDAGEGELAGLAGVIHYGED